MKLNTKSVFSLIVVLVAVSGMLLTCSTISDSPEQSSDVGTAGSDSDSAGADSDELRTVAAEEPSPQPEADDSSVRGAKASDAKPEAAMVDSEEEAPAEVAATSRGDSAGVGERSGARGSESRMDFAAVEEAGPSGLSAGFADDNRQYGFFVDFLREFRWVNHIPINVEERIMIQLLDTDGNSVPNALIRIADGDRMLESGLTHADGTYQFNPSLYAQGIAEYQVEVVAGGDKYPRVISRDGPRTVEIALQTKRLLPERIPLDITFVLDTTGSMGEEIARLKRTMEIIHLNLTSSSLPVDLRFGMVLYKDRGDEYVVKRVDLTGDIQQFRADLDPVDAIGGGDTPEDLQAALDSAVRELKWNDSGIRLAFVITDAPPHLDYGQAYDYSHAARDARSLGVKIFTVGTGGLEVDGEYVLRQISQFTGAKYIFLTYGERGESEGGRPGSVSHHTGANFVTDKLEAIIIRFAKEELSFLTDSPITDEDTYFTARKIDSEERERTLYLLFSQAIEQLAAYATIDLDAGMPAAVLPVQGEDGSDAADSEYFTEQLVLAASRSSEFRLVERENLQEIIEEQKLQLSGLTDSATVTRIGELMNASLLVSGTLYHRDSFELFLKLLRVETGEVLSVTKAIIDPALGLSR